GSGLRNSLRWQPAKLGGRVRNHLSGCIAVGLPNQSGSNTNAKYDQGAHKTARGSLVEGWLLDPSVGRANSRLDRRFGGPPIFRELGFCRAKRVNQRLRPPPSADFGAKGHPPVPCERGEGGRPGGRTGEARREESSRAAEIGEACERTEVWPHVAEGG